MRALVGFLLGVALTVAASSQMRQEWLYRYNGPPSDTDQAFAATVDPAGNVVATGGSIQSGANADIVTHEYSRAGSLLWSARYDGPGGGRDVGVAVGTDAGGNVYVLGTSYGGSATGDDWVIVKYNANGTPQWTRRYGGTGNDLATGLYVDAAGACYATGAVVGTGFQNFTVVKVGTNGTVVWDFRYDRSGGTDRGLAVRALASGVCYATGSMTGSGTNTDYATVRLSATGALQSIAFYNGPGNGPDEARDLALDASGNVTVTGSSRAVGLFDDIATLRYDADLNQLWLARYNGPANNDDWANALALDPFGNALVTGASVASGSGRDLTTLQYGPGGTPLAVQRYNGPGNQADEGTDIVADAAGNAFVVGSSVGAGTFKDFVLLKYEPGLAALQYAFRYNGPSSSDDTPWQVVLNANGDVAVTGMARGISTFDDYTTLLYRQDYPLTGTVVLSGFTGTTTGRTVRVWLAAPNGAEPAWTGQATLDAQGKFTLNGPLTGKVDARVKVGHWLRRLVPDLVVTASGASATFTLVNGDVNDDNSVNVADFLALRAAFGSASGSANWNPEADLNGNGTVNVTDFLILRANFGLVGD